MDLLAAVVLAVLLQSTVWCIPHPGVSCVDHNSSRIGSITHNSNRGNSYSNSHSSSNSTVHLHRRHNRLPAGHHSSFPSITFHASTVGGWATLLENVVCPSKAIRHELRHPWSISRGAIRRVPQHGRLVPTIPPWRRFPREKKCWRVCSPLTNTLLLFCLILEHHMIS
jgi:hypothetical protein